MTIFIVGKKSLIAKKLFFFLKNKFNVNLINLRDLKAKVINKYQNKYFIIINCSSKKKLIPSSVIDSDIQIVKKISKIKNFHYIMLSTSKVYGGKKLIKNEYDPCKPLDLYGKERLKSEKYIKKFLTNKKYTILRISNVLNFDNRKKTLSQTFINKMLKDLKFKGYIEIPEKIIIKDFIDEKNLNKCIEMIIKKKIFGIYNLSSGIPLNGNEISEYLISAYGKGFIKKNNILKTDNFVLNSKKLFKILNIKISKKYLKKKIIDLGKKLKDE